MCIYSNYHCTKNYYFVNFYAEINRFRHNYFYEYKLIKLYKKYIFIYLLDIRNKIINFYKFLKNLNPTIIKTIN